ncbi:MAG: PQQ-binding-like beta-propeller repeat protein [Caldisericia bacterium]
MLYCFDANTGTTIWKWEPNRTGTTGQICSGPTLVTYEDGLEAGQTWLIVGVNVSGGTALFALDAKTGVLMWGGSGIGLGAISRSDPVVAEGKIFQLTEDGTLFILDLKTKAVVGQTLLNESGLYEFHNTPAYHNGVLYCASRGKINTDEKGKIYMVETATGGVLKKTYGIDQFNKAGPTIYDNGEKVTVIIGSDTGIIYSFDGNDLHMVYSVNIKKPVTTDIILSGKYGFLGAANNFLAINVETGGTVFSQTLGNSITMHPVLTAGMVYVACNDAKLYAFSDHDDFVVDVLPRTDTIFSGNKKSYKVVITATMDFDSPMVLRASGLPTTITATFSKPFVYPGIDEQEVELTIEADENASPGNYICNIIGVLLGRERNTILQIQIVPPLTGDFKMSISQDQLTPMREIEAGDSISYQIKVEAIGGFNAEVAFFVNDETLPSSIDVMFMPDRLTPDGYITAIVSTDTSTPADKYNIEIQGHAGGKVRTTALWFTVGGFDTDDWPMFQHDYNRTGQVEEPFPENPELRYSAYIPSLFDMDIEEGAMKIRTQPIVALGLVYVVGEWVADEGSGDIHESAIFALDTSTGEPKWMYQFNKSVSVGKFGSDDDEKWPVLSTPAIDVETGKLYVGSIDGAFYCFDGKTGSKIWSRNTNPLIDIRGSVLIIYPDNKGINSKKVLFPTKSPDMYIVSLAKRMIKLWDRTLPSYVYSGLTYGYNKVSKQGMILAPCHDGNVYAMNVEDGNDVWSSPAGVYEFNGASTIAVDSDKDHFYMAGMMGPEVSVLATRRYREEISAMEIWVHGEQHLAQSQVLLHCLSIQLVKQYVM